MLLPTGFGWQRSTDIRLRSRHACVWPKQIESDVEGLLGRLLWLIKLLFRVDGQRPRRQCCMAISATALQPPARSPSWTRTASSCLRLREFPMSVRSPVRELRIGKRGRLSLKATREAFDVLQAHAGKPRYDSRACVLCPRVGHGSWDVPHGHFVDEISHTVDNMANMLGRFVASVGNVTDVHTANL